MNARIDKVRCFVCDLRRIWRNLRHEKVARWTIVVHVVYLVTTAISPTGWAHGAAALVCAGFLLLELVADR